MTDSILVVGGGVAGLHAALECANAGARVTVVETGPVVGGRLAAAMTQADGIGKRAEGLAIPLLEAFAGHERIDIFTNATLEALSGGAGNFDAAIRERARFVTDACTRCKLCHTACPVVRPNAYDADLTYRKAIYTPLPETLPAPYVIDIDSCLNTPPNYLPCNRCVEVCDDDAIRFDMPLGTPHRRHVGAVILAPGFQAEPGSAYRELGYGRHPDIVTSAELQRMLESPGPTGGYASKPSDEEYPERVLLVLDNLSHFALYIVASQVRQLLQQDVETVEVLVLSQPGPGAEAGETQSLADATGIDIRWGAMFDVDVEADGKLGVSYENFLTQRLVRSSCDLVVLCTDVVPATGLDELARIAGVEVASSGYLAVTASNGGAVTTSRDGVFVAGCASGAKNIRDSIAAAQTAAQAAVGMLDPRILNPGDSQPAGPETGRGTAVQPSAELQGQIEKLLHALLEKTPG